MENINLGGTIRLLRKKKGITQEALAQAIGVSAQAVSKWEMNASYPDMALIPVLAGYFEVTLDTLFGYDMAEVKKSIQNIIDGARPYFFDDTARYAETMKAALRDHPGNEDLLCALLDAYEYDLRERKITDHLEDMVELSLKIISESGDFVKVCSVKDTLAAAYLAMDRYDDAKEVLESLPDAFDTKDDVMSFRLKGKDKMDASVWSRCHHLQKLYQACLEEGDCWLSVIGTDLYPNCDKVSEALRCYNRGEAVLTAFILDEYEGEDKYMWAGMQTFHYIFRQRKAACYKKMGRIPECEAEIEAAYEIVSTSWHDFEECRDEIMGPFNRYLRDYDLGEYVK
ncbi:MAG: helix-turn-helix transcriptional regulator [Clostridia bacterium]|nr:helix-turn-helix transcriptional regulator [Clostridia bacterium]MBQ8334389.1 helix-turn-helix transcriptional regulator [Clostridia bacterium]